VAVLRSIQGGAPGAAGGFELAYVTRDGARARVLLADARALRLERAAPVQQFASYQGQRHLPGRWWSATTSGTWGMSRGWNAITSRELAAAGGKVSARTVRVKRTR